MEVTADPLLGSELLGYRLEALIGRGGMGVVYRAYDPRLKRDVALKLLTPEYAADERFRERFLGETEQAASLEHPNVIPIHDAGEVDGQLYLVMRLADGGDLKKLLAAHEMLEPRETIEICEQLATALDAAHEIGLVHRDVKPSNVLLDRRGHVYLADFGLSRRLSEQAPDFEAGLSLGTPAYVAPEQIEGKEVDGRADLYSLACLLHECLTGRAPFPRASEAATLFAHLEEPPPALPGLEHVFARGLAKDPADRYESCAELVADAQAALGITVPGRSRWATGVAALALVLVVAALAAIMLMRGDGAPPQAQQGRLLRIDTSSNRVQDSAVVGNGPQAVAAGGGRVWVASYDEGSLWQLDPTTGGMARVPAFGRPYAVAIVGPVAYVASLGPGKFAGNVSTFDVVTGGRIGGIPQFACSLSEGRFGVWAAGCPNVLQLGSSGSGQDPRVVATIPIPFAQPLTAENYREALTGIAVGAGAVWVVGDASDRRLWRIDPRTHRIAATLELGFPPGGVATGGGAVWVTDELGDRLVRIDAKTNRIAASIPVGAGAQGVAFGAGSVWVGGAVAHTVTRIDPATNEAVATIQVHANPKALAVGGNVLWVVGDAR